MIWIKLALVAALTLAAFETLRCEWLLNVYYGTFCTEDEQRAFEARMAYQKLADACTDPKLLQLARELPP